MFHLLFIFVQWLNDTPMSVYLRESDWPFPMIETIHILGLGFSVGTVMWLDLRLLKLAMREVPVADVIEQLEPWAIGGFAVMFLSGTLLILSEPLKCYNTVAFRIKVVLRMLACLNVLYFHKSVIHDVDQWDQHMPWRAKMAGAFSLVLWLAIVGLRISDRSSALGGSCRVGFLRFAKIPGPVAGSSIPSGCLPLTRHFTSWRWAC
jgi:hypothetical protein